MRRILSILLVPLLLLLPWTRAEAVDDDEPTPGTEYTVGGIVLTSVGGLVGGMSMLVAISVYDDAMSKRYLGIGALSLGVGLGAGIPLIVYGHREHQRWRQWQKSQKEAASVRLNVAPLPHGGGATTLTWDF